MQNPKPEKYDGQGWTVGRSGIETFWVDCKMNNQVYHDLSVQKVWPAVRSKASRHNLWFMQDGANCHTTENNLTFLNQRFNGRIVSNKTDVVWPP